MTTTKALAAAALAVSIAFPALVKAADAPRPTSDRAVDLTGLSVGFGPSAGADELVTRVIGSAKRRIRVCGRVFASARMAKLLADAREKRQIDVAVVLDAKANTQEDMTGKSKAAMNQLAAAKVPTRLARAFERTNGNFIVVDDETVLTGSFEFADQARRSSNDVMVLWKRPDVGGEYLKHWESIWHQAIAYQGRK